MSTASTRKGRMTMAEFVPEFRGVIEGFVVNFLKRNMWRVERYLEYEDMMQEARVVFHETARRYHYVDSPQWFFSLFKVSFINRFNDLSKKAWEVRQRTVSLTDDPPCFESISGPLDNEGAAGDLLRGVPQEVLEVLCVLTMNPVELLTVSVSGRMGKNRRSRVNRILCQALGRDCKTTDLITELEKHLSIKLI